MPRRPILLLANSSWNLTHQRRGLIRGLREGGLPLAAAVPTGEPAIAPDIATHHFPLRPEGLAPAAELRSVVALMRLFREVRPAAVLSFTPKGNIYAGLAARMTRIPLLPNVSGLGTAFIKGGILLKIQAALYREAFHGVPVVFFQNEEDAALFVRMGLVKTAQVRLIPGSGVDCDYFRPSPVPKSSGTTKLLFVGRLLGDKGVRELAEAMRLLRPRQPQLKLTLIGESGAANRTAIGAEEIKGWEREGLLRHAGQTDDVRPYIAAADAVVLPSYREGMPKALLEGAAMGRPLLAADVPGCRQICRHGSNGLLFEARSAEGLAAAIDRFVGTPAERRRAWGDESRRIIEAEFDEKLVVQAYRDALVAIMNKAG